MDVVLIFLCKWERFPDLDPTEGLDRTQRGVRKAVLGHESHCSLCFVSLSVSFLFMVVQEQTEMRKSTAFSEEFFIFFLSLTLLMLVGCFCKNNLLFF
ncbi:hypothetical protein F5H01DRAFT_199287 [Linnemannia elongata]|nr:hypothetical protein F5H01DRAFT_199287 [Linnemannia elongata]